MTAPSKFRTRSARRVKNRWPEGRVCPCGRWRTLWRVCFLLCPVFALAAQKPVCTLRPSLYQEWRQVKRRYDRVFPGPATNEISAQKAEIEKRYYRFLYSLAWAAQHKDERLIEQCLRAATGDPIASQMAALVEYVHGNRKAPSRFITALPGNEQQLAAFWDLDDMVSGGTRESPLPVPGVSLPDGLVDKFITELYGLVLQQNSAAARKYFYIYRHSDGEYAEYLAVELIDLFRNHPEVVLRQWQVVKLYSKRIAVDLSSYSPEGWQKGVESLRNACRRHPYSSCTQALRIFR